MFAILQILPGICLRGDVMQDKNQKNTMERRAGNDRRCWECKHEFPYIDSHGTLVTGERRKVQRRDPAHARIKSASSN